MGMFLPVLLFYQCLSSAACPCRCCRIHALSTISCNSFLQGATKKEETHWNWLQLFTHRFFYTKHKLNCHFTNARLESFTWGMSTSQSVMCGIGFPPNVTVNIKHLLDSCDRANEILIWSSVESLRADWSATVLIFGSLGDWFGGFRLFPAAGRHAEW